MICGRTALQMEIGLDRAWSLLTVQCGVCCASTSIVGLGQCADHHMLGPFRRLVKAARLLQSQAAAFAITDNG
jgi:hypothetical protein